VKIDCTDSVPPSDDRDNKIFCVKLNSADFQKGGFTEDESIVVIRELTPLVDFIEVSGGTYENPVMMTSKT
jgi:2,4-dienoyl-CoA reductase-like NADH-dependent reductase (Old Yellow Enzyme family)